MHGPYLKQPQPPSGIPSVSSMPRSLSVMVCSWDSYECWRWHVFILGTCSIINLCICAYNCVVIQSGTCSVF